MGRDGDTRRAGRPDPLDTILGPEPTEEEWRAGRHGKIGASLAPAICLPGVLPWLSPLSAYESAMGVEVPVNLAMRAGSALERVTLEEIESASGGLRLWPNGHRWIQHPSLPWLGCTPDAWISRVEYPTSPADLVGIVQAKTTSSPARWEAGAPEDVECQARTEALVVDAAREAGGLPALEILAVGVLLLVRPMEVRGPIILDTNPDVRAWILERLSAFERDHLSPSIPPAPTGSEADTATVKRLLRRAVDSSVALGADAAEMVACIQAIKDDLEPKENEERRLRSMLMMMMGGATVGVLPDGRKLTFRETTRREYVVKASIYRELRLPRREKGGA